MMNIDLERERVIEGTAGGLIDYIKRHNIAVDTLQLEQLVSEVKAGCHEREPAFVLESRRVRTQLRAYFQTH